MNILAMDEIYSSLHEYILIYCILDPIKNLQHTNLNMLCGYNYFTVTIQLQLLAVTVESSCM